MDTIIVKVAPSACCSSPWLEYFKLCFGFFSNSAALGIVPVGDVVYVGSYIIFNGSHHRLEEQADSTITEQL